MCKPNNQGDISFENSSKLASFNDKSSFEGNIIDILCSDSLNDILSSDNDILDNPEFVSFLNKLPIEELLNCLKVRIKVNFIDVIKNINHFKLSKEDIFKLGKYMIDNKFFSIPYLETLIEGVPFIKLPHPENISHILPGFNYLIKNGILTSNQLKVLTYNNRKIHNIKLLWPSVLKLGNSEYDPIDIQKKLISEITGFDLLSLPRIPEDKISDLYDILRSFHEFLGSEKCRFLLNLIHFDFTDINNKQAFNTLVVFLSKLYRHQIIIGKDNDSLSNFLMNYNRLSIEDINSISNMIDDKDKNNFIKISKQYLGFPLDIYKLEEMLVGDIDSLLLLSGRINNEKTINRSADLYYSILLSLIEGKDEYIKFDGSLIHLLNKDKYEEQLNTVQDIEIWQAAKQHLLVLDNAEEVEAIKGSKAQFFKEAFLKEVDRGLLSEYGYNKGFDHNSITSEELEVIGSNNLLAIKDGLMKSENKFQKYIHGILHLITNSNDSQFIVKAIQILIGKSVAERSNVTTDQNTNLNPFSRGEFRDTLKQSKAIQAINPTKKAIFISSISDPKTILELGNRKTLKARSCLDYLYVNDMTDSLMSFIVDPCTKLFITRELDESLFKDRLSYNTFLDNIEKKTFTVDFDSKNRLLTVSFLSNSEKTTIKLNDAIMRKVARLGTTEDNMKKLIWDNELSQDNIFHDKIESLMHNMLHNLAESIGGEIYSGGKVKFIGSSTPGGTYSDIAGGIKQQGDDINIWK